uniref:Putative odorant binding protein 3 n=1 Tax=Ectropis obliqua TaxID=248899 RepID=A0A1W5LAX9_ECTOB|nr:putative odorant binding protein 3 [Ectropis obliqua]
MKILFCFVLLTYTSADLIGQPRNNKEATLKPISTCCDIPELGDPKPLAECSNPKLPGPCNDVQCVFEKSGFLVDKSTLNKETYKAHLRQWAEKHKDWSAAVERAIEDCVDKNLRQYLDIPCTAYDVFTCTSIAMLKKCPASSWKC